MLELTKKYFNSHHNGGDKGDSSTKLGAFPNLIPIIIIIYIVFVSTEGQD